MKFSLPDVPILRSVESEVRPEHFNVIRLAQRRLGAPLREVLGLRGLEFHVGHNAWVCFDRCLDHRPILAWTSFLPQVRAGLHEPVACRVLHYHPFAPNVATIALEELGRRLRMRLRASGDREAVVLTLRRAEHSLAKSQ
jgi:hypothetical protein